LPQQHAFPQGVPKILPELLRLHKFVVQSITVWLQSQDGPCSDFLTQRGFHQKPCFLLFLNGSCVNIPHIQLAQLKDTAVADVRTPDQALAVAGIMQNVENISFRKC